ncbi:MAG: hypothetical protein P8M70_00665 [Verrucomicrobiota bacterium]|nr:hypothetical protein [Verrucomicrobiota bacterium]
MKHQINSLLEKLDKYSPHPIFYKFVMSKVERAIFDKSISKAENYLEFGLGGSTLRALQKSNAKIYSVESSHEWISYMREYSIIRNNENKRLVISAVDIGPTQEWGIPREDNNRNLFPAYSENIFNEINKNELDTALVDGRFRAACALKIILECHQNDKLQLMIHDFWNRQEYHVVLKYLNTIDKADSLGLFCIKKNVDLESAYKDYQVYKYICD